MEYAPAIVNTPGSACSFKRAHETVLLVEDEPALMKLARMMLQKMGFTVLTSQNPMEAIRIVQKYAGTIHLLITDIIMPEMNGRDLTVVLQGIKPGLKCLFMSGYSADVLAHQGSLENVTNFIAKPFTYNDLSLKISAILGDRS
jgi:two-component system, cell cycle sensor histidine kinase and response regulator CckA